MPKVKRLRASTLLFLILLLLGKQQRVLAEELVSRDFDKLEYSEACSHPESGDLLGEFFVIVRMSADYYVMYEPMNPEEGPVQISRATIKNGKITFNVNDYLGEKEFFSGTITKDAVEGEFSGDHKKNWRGEKKFHFRRVDTTHPDIIVCGQ